MVDPYCYEDTPVLRNTLDIRDEKTLDLIEAEQSRANMMLLYEQGFHDFTPEGLQSIHRFLFGDIYQWAGEYRIINIAKREKLLAGRSVWLRMIWLRPFRIFSVRIGRRCPEKHLYRLSFGALRRSGRYIRSARGTPGRW